MYRIALSIKGQKWHNIFILIIIFRFLDSMSLDIQSLTVQYYGSLAIVDLPICWHRRPINNRNVVLILHTMELLVGMDISSMHFLDLPECSADLGKLAAEMDCGWFREVDGRWMREQAGGHGYLQQNCMPDHILCFPAYPTLPLLGHTSAMVLARGPTKGYIFAYLWSFLYHWMQYALHWHDCVAHIVVVEQWYLKWG